MEEKSTDWEKAYQSLAKDSVSLKKSNELFGLGILLGYLAGAIVIGFLLAALHDPQTCLISSNTSILILGAGLVGVPFVLFWLITRNKKK